LHFKNDKRNRRLSRDAIFTFDACFANLHTHKGERFQESILSRRTVFPPTITASLCARVLNTRARESSPDTHAACPLLAAIFPTKKMMVGKQTPGTDHAIFGHPSTPEV
jgi:hypothetical protein